MHLNERFLTGTGDAPAADFDGHLLQPEVAEAFRRLVAAAGVEGFELSIASAYRTFERQLAIWNGKLSGERAVLDAADRPVDMAALGVSGRLEAVLRFSALPGASRHHWGTDIDVYDAVALAEGCRVQLCTAEVVEGGVFAPLHNWLDERIERGESFGFYRPYGRDRGGVAPERWHLSYAPLADACASALSPACLRRCWQREAGGGAMLFHDHLLEQVEPLLERYVRRIDSPPAGVLSGAG